MEEKFNVKYDCGCIHELSRDTSKGVFMYTPTGKNEDCNYHSK